MTFHGCMTGIFFIGAAGLLSACGHASDAQGCTHLTCEPHWSYIGIVTLSQKSTDLLRVKACRNATCSTTDVQLLESATTSTGSSGAPETELELFAETDGRPTRHVVVRIKGTNEELKDGDVYHLVIEDQTTKTTLLDFTSAPVHYRSYQPNGACDGPYHCQVASQDYVGP